MTDYTKVLADLERVRDDAEAGIRAIRRLMDGGAVLPAAAPVANHDSVPARTMAFFEARRGEPCSAEQVAEALGPDVSLRTLRSALARLVTGGQLKRAKRGKYAA